MQKDIFNNLLKSMEDTEDYVNALDLSKMSHEDAVLFQLIREAADYGQSKVREYMQKEGPDGKIHKE